MHAEVLLRQCWLWDHRLAAELLWAYRNVCVYWFTSLSPYQSLCQVPLNNHQMCAVTCDKASPYWCLHCFMELVIFCIVLLTWAGHILTAWDSWNLDSSHIFYQARVKQMCCLVHCKWMMWWHGNISHHRAGWWVWSPSSHSLHLCFNNSVQHRDFVSSDGGRQKLVLWDTAVRGRVVCE